MRIIRKIIMLVIVAFVAVLQGCNKKDDGDKLIETNMNTSSLVETKKTYYRGDEFSPGQTYVNLTYFDKGSNTKWTLKDYTLTSLSTKISDINYEINGFDTSSVTDSMNVTITFTSKKYANSVSTSFNVKVLPEYVVSSEVIDEEEHIREEYYLNESFPYEGMKLTNTYSNGRTETIDVTLDMISGFDTSEASVNKKTMKITQNNFELEFDYVVVPSDKYNLLSTFFIKTFVPSESSGFTKTINQNEYDFYKKSVANFKFGYYSKFSYSETSIKNLYNTSGSIYKNNVTIISYKTQKINGIDLTICEFKNTNSTILYTGIYFDRQVSLPNGNGYTVSNVTVEILLSNYAGNNNQEVKDILSNVLNYISK